MTETELESAISDVKSALNGIVSEAEKFAKENILSGIFGFGGWNDSCGRKISEMVISTVEDALDKNLKIYDCESKLDKIADNVSSLISIIEAAKKELQ